MKYYKKKEIVC